MRGGRSRAELAAVVGVVLATALPSCRSGSGVNGGAPPDAPPTIRSFGASPAVVNPGGSSLLSWSVDGATSLSIAPDVEGVTGSSVTVTPSGTTTYTLTATNAHGSSTASTTVTVQPVASVRFVATDGSDANPGTEALPWRTIQKAFDAAQPGQVVYIRGGTYRERPVLRVSGTAEGGRITFRNLGSDVVTIDGTGTEQVDDYLLSITDRSHVRVEGLFLTGNVLDDGGGILVHGSGRDVAVVGCNISGIRPPVAGAGHRTHPLLVAGTALRDVTISGNVVHDVVTGDSEALTVSCNVDGFVVEGNHVHDTDATAIDVTGGYSWCFDPAGSPPRNGVIRGNLVERAGTLPYGGVAIGVDGGRDIVVERNVVRDSAIAFDAVAEVPYPAGLAARIVFRDNLAHGNTVAFTIGEYPVYQGRTDDVQVLHNTVHDNGTGVTLQPATGVVLRENILSGNRIQVMNQAGGDPVAASLDYNLYWGSGVFYWGSTTDLSFAAYRAATGQDPNGLLADPLFVSTGPAIDLRLQAASPARDRGDPAFVPAAGELDAGGLPRVVGGRVDVGAHEYQ